MRLDHLLSREKAKVGIPEPIPGRSNGETRSEEKHARHASQILKEKVDN